MLPNISAKFKLGHPQWWRQMQVGRLKLAIFDILLAISQKQYKIDA